MGKHTHPRSQTHLRELSFFEGANKHGSNVASRLECGARDQAVLGFHRRPKSNSRSGVVNCHRRKRHGHVIEEKSKRMIRPR